MPDLVAPEFIALQRALAGRYSLERELGRGGMGIVFLARDVALDRPVAIKLLPPVMAAQPALRQRFLLEARTAAKLSHPNVVPIHAVEESGDLVFFVMAYVEGESLGERLRAKGPLTPHETARMLQAVAWALGYAHGRGVVHRDVKPDNIMLERDTGRAVVMDFGIAAAGEAEAGEVLGTAQYVSPEQANGDPVDGRSDIYSLGVVGFVSLSGRLPFRRPRHGGPARDAHREAGPAPCVDRCRGARPPGARRGSLPGQEPRGPLPDRRGAGGRARRSHRDEARSAGAVASLARHRRGPFRLAYFWLGPSWPWPPLGQPRALGRPIPGRPGWSRGVSPDLPPLAIAGGHRAWHLRRLLAAGYGLEDARLAVRDPEKRRGGARVRVRRRAAAVGAIAYRATIALGVISLAGFVGLLLGAGAAPGRPAFLVSLTAITGPRRSHRRRGEPDPPRQAANEGSRGRAAAQVLEQPLRHLAGADRTHRPAVARRPRPS